MIGIDKDWLLRRKGRRKEGVIRRKCRRTLTGNLPYPERILSPLCVDRPSHYRSLERNQRICPKFFPFAFLPLHQIGRSIFAVRRGSLAIRRLKVISHATLSGSDGA